MSITFCANGKKLKIHMKKKKTSNLFQCSPSSYNMQLAVCLEQCHELVRDSLVSCRCWKRKIPPLSPLYTVMFVISSRYELIPSDIIYHFHRRQICRQNSSHEPLLLWFFFISTRNMHTIGRRTFFVNWKCFSLRWEPCSDLLIIFYVSNIWMCANFFMFYWPNFHFS